MSKVTETRVKITLTDAMSGPLRGIQGQLNSTNTAANNLSRSLKDYVSIGAGIAAGATGIYSLTDKIGEMFSKGTGFYKSMETNAIGMAGILSSMTTLNGETLKWNDALNISQGIIKNLNDDALKTAATSEELITTFRALLGPGLGAGMTVEQIQKLTTVGVNAVKSLGLNNTQLVQELRDLVQGGIQPASSTLATALGLKDSDIKAAKESAEGLYSFLMKRLAGFEQAALATPKTLAGMQDQLNDLMAELDRKILEDTGSQFEINMAKLDEDLQKMQSKIDKAALAGVDTSEVAKKLAEFESQEIIRIKRQEVLDKHQLDMDYIDARQEANLLSAQQADEQRLAELNSYKAQLQEMLSTQRLTLEQRLQLEQEYAATIQAIQQAQATDWLASWDSVLAHVRDTQFDQLATLEDGWDNITSTITNFGQNMLTEQKSFSGRCKDLYNDLANSIMNTMMKVIMQGLVMKAVLGAFGLGGGSNIAFTSDPSWKIDYMPHANGGIASGWSLVGERGPELVNFTNPGRVYTAEQTAAALGGKGNPTNIKVVIENRSGEKVEATSANTSFDGEGLIVGIVLDAIRTNKNGMQDAIKSLAGNY